MSQHLFAIAADIERYALVLRALEVYDMRKTQPFTRHFEEAQDSLATATAILLRLGNELQEPR